MAIFNLINMRFGVIEDNGLAWCKLGTLSDEIENDSNFSGQRFIEFSVDSSSASRVSSSLRGKIPCEVDLITSVRVKKGVPTMVVTGIAE